MSTAIGYRGSSIMAMATHLDLSTGNNSKQQTSRGEKARSGRTLEMVKMETAFSLCFLFVYIRVSETDPTGLVSFFL
uniref:Uncharacterized protein n=1 Tax=Rhizophora mucronata TaxID=61149 RepID=A0A2P2LZL3_RHIMU